jgi:chemotaxis signal transduction protein
MSEIVVFDVSGFDCAVEMRDLLSVAAYEQPVRLPGAKPGIHGILGFMQKPVLVVNLAELFCIEPAVPTSQRCIAIVRGSGSGDRSCGLIVDALRSVIDETACSEGQEGSPIPAEYVRKSLRYRQAALTLLAVDRIHENATGGIT